MSDPRRQLPSVDTLLRDPEVQELLASHPRQLVVDAVRAVLEAARAGGASGTGAAAVRHEVERQDAPTLAPVLNATGVVLHTNLGRAPVAAVAADAMARAAAGYATLEFDLDAGTRGSRLDHCRRLLAQLAGAEDGMAVVNGAGALVLALHAAAAGREVIISRGELIEIGGSFRLPEIVAAAGVVLREVGTTNRTRVADYERALSPATGAIVTVHRSNFSVDGFTETPRPAEVAAAAHRAGVPYLVDLGSGLLQDLTPWGLGGEPTVGDLVASGADAVIFSGDKLLGGPQAGCIVGRADMLARCRVDPLARAMRCDKVALAGLAETLRLHRDPATARREIPVLAMLTLTPEALAARASELAAQLGEMAVPARLAPGSSVVGGGAFPGHQLTTTLVVIDIDTPAADTVARRLRIGSPHIVARIEDGRVVIDCRTLPAEALPVVARAVAAAAAP